MEGWEARYFPALANFVLFEGSQGKEIADLRLELLGVPTDVILRQHEESVRILLLNAEMEDRMTVIHRSLLFLVEILAALRLPEAAADREEDHDQLKAALVQALPIPGEKPSQFETVLQHMDSGIALFSADGRLRFLNVQMAKLLQAPRRMMIGNTFKQLLFHPYLRKPVRAVFLRMYKEMVLYRRFYSEFQDAGGRFVLVSITQIEELGGDYLVSVKDVSEYKHIEQTALQNDKLAMLGKIAASIAHEIRNPLTSIRGFIQLLRPYLESVGKQEYARIILSEIDRANDIIYEFLNSSKPSAPMKQRIAVASLIKETILLTESEAHMKGCELQYEIYDPDICVAVDVKQIKQVLLNIVKNAMDAILSAGDRRKGLIAISVRREGRMAAIRIRDNGKGMDRATLGRLFDPFFTTKEEGNGLGLSVSYRIIRNHGGTIQVDSQLNEGTEFIIYLPPDMDRE
ncbi:ATP-binding protein [Cohnella lubricantis]|uniref:histidine kinase n=1 Tax=Cohnella lubricantis TaxID=2163172 RepID=A0A841TGR1_9BACL|nr:ATP-binding protein [Cohnella lubricantis]MBB6678448.1 PAS-domain containing protein [Cohnella lubricantis]MBP2116828.1 PAS domain S-box-containing protein [Cohnella lubricantis]